MALDRTKLGNLAQEQMEALEASYGNDPNVEIGAVLTIVQIVSKTGEGEYESAVRMRHNLGGDPYTVIGLLKAAEMTVTQQLGT